MYLACLVTWILVGFGLFKHSRNYAKPCVGLSLAYYLNFALIHWFGALICYFPWYEPIWTTRAVIERGFFLSTVGLVSFAFGCMLLAPAFLRWQPKKISPIEIPITQIKVLAKLGIFFFFCVFFLSAARITSVGALFSAGVHLAIIAVALSIYRGFKKKNFILVRKSILVALFFPIITVVVHGYMGYGIGFLIIVYGMLSILYPHPKKFVLVTLLVTYSFLSFYVAYMKTREEIRVSVWGEKSYFDRFEKVGMTFFRIEPLSPYNEEHLQSIDNRLNQNWLVGQSDKYMEENEIFANGETLWMDLTAPIPRVLWPDKPFVAGSMDIASKFTGINFSESTSVGLGPVFESFINFGIVGIIVCMGLHGLLIGLADLKARKYLDLGANDKCVKWYLIGIASQNVIWNYGEMFTNIITSILLYWLLSNFGFLHGSPLGRRVVQGNKGAVDLKAT